ncbi:MAG: glycogen synthase, partial [Deltaproteobacteria bacterium]|nr:glycogen synthase [Deltaproteobacteria bacterium]
PNGLSWAIDEAMGFFNRPSHVKADEITRIMRESKAAFNHSVTARRYMDLYEKMLERPLIND